MKAKSLITSMVGIFLALFVLACDDDDSSKASMEDVLPDVGEELPVNLDATTNVGNLTFDVSGIDSSEGAVEAFGEYLVDGTIQVVVTARETNTNYSITDGTYVPNTPSAAGQYSYTVAGSSLYVSFYNMYNGASLDATKEYFATVTVRENAYFDAGTYPVEISLM